MKVQRYWHVRQKMWGYLVCLTVLDEEYNSFINQDHWDNHPCPVDLLRITINRLQRKAVDGIFPTTRGRFLCDLNLE